MKEEHKPRLLLEFLFGDSAETAQRSASPRLLVWAEAFDGWIAERSRKYKPGTVNNSRLSWRRLLQERSAMPWQLREGDIQAHVAWMETESELHLKCNSS